MANKKPWGFIENPFRNATNGSFRMSVRISDFHLGALLSKEGDSVFDQLIAFYTPFNTALKTAYNKWKADSGMQQGKTLLVEQLLKDLGSEKIKAWDIAIQGVYSNTTPQYKSLLPNNRGPFQQGSQEDRLSAVSALVDAIGADAALAAVKTLAQTFVTDFQAALTAQKSSITTTKSSSDAVEAARLAMCMGQYSNLGALIHNFAEAPENIEQYFDLAVIRTGAQTVFTGDTKPLEHENIMKHTFAEGDNVLLKNEGVTELKFYLAPQKKDAPEGEAFVIVSAGKEILVAASLLGNIANAFFNVLNPDELNEGEWTVELQ